MDSRMEKDGNLGGDVMLNRMGSIILIIGAVATAFLGSAATAPAAYAGSLPSQGAYCGGGAPSAPASSPVGFAAAPDTTTPGGNSAGVGPWSPPGPGSGVPPTGVSTQSSGTHSTNSWDYIFWNTPENALVKYPDQFHFVIAPQVCTGTGPDNVIVWTPTSATVNFGGPGNPSTTVSPVLTAPDVNSVTHIYTQATQLGDNYTATLTIDWTGIQEYTNDTQSSVSYTYTQNTPQTMAGTYTSYFDRQFPAYNIDSKTLTYQRNIVNPYPVTYTDQQTHIVGVYSIPRTRYTTFPYSTGHYYCMGTWAQETFYFYLSPGNQWGGNSGETHIAPDCGPFTYYTYQSNYFICAQWQSYQYWQSTGYWTYNWYWGWEWQSTGGYWAWNSYCVWGYMAFGNNVAGEWFGNYHNEQSEVQYCPSAYGNGSGSCAEASNEDTQIYVNQHTGSYNKFVGFDHYPVYSQTPKTSTVTSHYLTQQTIPYTVRWTVQYTANDYIPYTQAYTYVIIDTTSVPYTYNYLACNGGSGTPLNGGPGSDPGNLNNALGGVVQNSLDAPGGCTGATRNWTVPPPFWEAVVSYQTLYYTKTTVPWTTITGLRPQTATYQTQYPVYTPGTYITYPRADWLTLTGTTMHPFYNVYYPEKKYCYRTNWTGDWWAGTPVPYTDCYVWFGNPIGYTDWYPTYFTYYQPRAISNPYTITNTGTDTYSYVEGVPETTNYQYPVYTQTPYIRATLNQDGVLVSYDIHLQQIQFMTIADLNVTVYQGQGA